MCFGYSKQHMFWLRNHKDNFQFHTVASKLYRIEPRHEISNNVVCAANKASDQPAHTRSLIRAFASCLIII